MLRRHLLAGWLVDSPLRLGIIGAGNRGASLGAVAAQVAGVDVTALCGIQLSQTARLASRLPRPLQNLR
jgi:predicted homoserine dehydrogenase-like protein